MRISDWSSDVCSSDLDDAIEAQRVQQPRNEQPREESNKKAQEQRRDEDACNIDLADHAAGLHAGLCLNRARRRPTRPRTSGLFSPEALRSASDSVESIWASRVGDGASRPISARTACSSRSATCLISPVRLSAAWRRSATFPPARRDRK